MTTDVRALETVRQAVRSEPRYDAHEFPLKMELDNEVLTLEGEVANVAVKKLVMERAAALPTVRGVVDRLRVVPAQAMGDGEIRAHLRDALLGEPSFAACALGVDSGATCDRVQSPQSPAGNIVIAVVDGVVTLDGEVPSLSHKRLAGALAWWVPGSRDVVNGLGVEPDEADNDDEVRDAVTLILEKDPFVDASQIGIKCADYVVTLSGIVPTDAAREMAEFDAWYTFGVDRVINDIRVRPAE